MSSAARNTWKMIKPHVPLIQFKKGGPLSQVSGKSSGGSATNRGTQTTMIDESMLPPRYLRKPISDLEMQVIELGGIQAL